MSHIFRSSKFRIIGGAVTSDFPDCVATGNDTNGYFCSGVLIHKNMVLTAKHCTDLDIKKAFIGGWDVDFKLNTNQTYEIRNVLSVYTHPMLDMSILQLKEDASFRPCEIITTEDVERLNPKICTVVGFGRIDTNGTFGYGKKRFAEVSVTRLSCKNNQGCLDNLEMIAGHRGLNKDTCFGDSGGPLYVKMNGRYFLLGITSRGIKKPSQPCGDGGIYIRVDKAISWIESIKNIIESKE